MKSKKEPELAKIYYLNREPFKVFKDGLALVPVEYIKHPHPISPKICIRYSWRKIK